MQVRPLTPSRLIAELCDQLAAHLPDQSIAVAIDGAEATDPHVLAQALIDPLRVRGRPAWQVRSDDFLRPASVRFEHGRTNPQAFYHHWLDTDALGREVLQRIDAAGDGKMLPTLWNPLTDRATRSAYVEIPTGAVVLVSGSLLLGAGLAFDLTVHLLLSPEALQRRTAAPRQWTLPAYAQYAAEVAPAALADVVVRVDNPQRPAVVDAW